MIREFKEKFGSRGRDRGLGTEAAPQVQGADQGQRVPNALA
jgi:hypothetical protein